MVDDEDYGTAAFADGDYVWAARGSLVHWLPEVIGEQYDRGELDMLDVVVRAEVTVLAGGGVVGVFCREVPDTDAEWQWYEFVVRDGYAAIRKADLEGNVESLAETTGATAPLGQPVEIEAACADRPDGAAALSLTVDGTTVLSVTTTIPSATVRPACRSGRSRRTSRWTFAGTPSRSAPLIRDRCRNSHNCF